jgi:hypothetical protein
MWQTCSMHLLFVSILNIFVCTSGHFQSEFSFATDSVYQISFKAQIARGPHPIPIRAFGRAFFLQALGFKCIICNAEFASRRAADCSHPASCGMACADPSNMQSLSLTERPDPSARTQDQSRRYIGQDNDDQFPSHETVSALVLRHATPGGRWRR